MSNIDENVMLTSRLIEDLSGIPSVLDFINDRPVNVFFKQVGTIFRKREGKERMSTVIDHRFFFFSGSERIPFFTFYCVKKT